MNFRERTLNIFQRRPVDNIVFQPRIHYWFYRNKELGTLPQPFRNMKCVLDAFDEMGCSIRSYRFFDKCLEKVLSPRVKFKTFVSGVGQIEEPSPLSLREKRAQFLWEVYPAGGGTRIERWSTPVGTLETHISWTNSAWRMDKYPVETPEDIRIMKYILESTAYRFNMDSFREADALIGQRSTPMIWLPRVNIQRLSVELMGFENTIFDLHDQPKLMEDFIRAIDAIDERVLDVIVTCPVPIVSFDDNMDQNLVSPDLFKRYVLPAYRHRVERLHAARKTCHAHWDGSCRLLLPLAPKTGLDGIEALTPEPQGDMTIEEIKTALGEDMILLDGIPAVLFLPSAKDKDLERATKRIIELFAPNLILGVSDSPPLTCSVEKIRLVSKIVDEYEGKVMELPNRR